MTMKRMLQGICASVKTSTIYGMRYLLLFLQVAGEIHSYAFEGHNQRLTKLTFYEPTMESYLLKVMIITMNDIKVNFRELSRTSAKTFAKVN